MTEPPPHDADTDAPSAPTPISRSAVRSRRTLIALGLACVVVAIGTAACSILMRKSPAPAGSVSAMERVEGEPDIRVRIMRSQDAVRVRLERGVARLDGLVTPLAGESLIRLNDDAWLIEPADGAPVRLPRSSESPLVLDSGDRDVVGIEAWNVIGDVHLHPRGAISPGLFDVIEHVAVEQYLPGVLARELYASWSLDAYKAQAIAARSYALHERLRRLSIGSHFDVESTTRDQAYGGVTDHQTAIRAVQETTGIVLTVDGHILRSYYSSTCGGRPASAVDTWPTGRGFEYNLDPPIQGRPRDHFCQFSPLHTWTVERDLDDLSKRFRRYGRDHGLEMKRMKRIRSIEPDEINDAGRVSHYRVTDTTGASWRYKGETVRLACNDESDAALPKITRETRVHSSDCTFTIRDGRVVIDGRGFGHGVGLCQYGAEGMARDGVDVTSMLRSFYPGAVLERAY